MNIINLLENSKIYKNHRYKIIKSVLKYSNLESIKNSNYKYYLKQSNNKIKAFNVELNAFKEVLNNNFNKQDLGNFNRNISDTSIFLLPTKNILAPNDCGGYNFITNKIILYSKDRSSLYHELFHLASSNRKSNGFYYTGENKDSGIGYGLNEGYTELLVSKCFYSDNVYEFEKIVAKYLEIIIGENLMKSIYLKADLKELVNILKKYNNDLAIKNFLTRLDYYTIYGNREFITDREEDFIFNQIKHITQFLNITYSNKIDLDNNISIKEKEELKDDFEYNLSQSINSIFEEKNNVK